MKQSVTQDIFQHIQQLSILGIRSFSPEKAQVIEFGRPLTVIVGANGAGKTTIIECLKQACSGDLPPNVGRTGHGFIHDPKIQREREIKAQIKLKFISIDQVPIVVSRLFSLSQQNKKMTFKQLEQSIISRNPKTGQRQISSLKCQDLDQQVVQMMGVQGNKAILENVLLVHQEECNWPLSDGATLKKKFDDIFAASKYTKALDTLRKIAKDKKFETQKFHLKMETLKNLVEQVQKLQKQIDDGREIQYKREHEVSRFEKQQQECEQAIAEIIQLDKGLQDIKNDIQKLQIQQESQQKVNSDLYEKMPDGDLSISSSQIQDNIRNMNQNELVDQDNLRQIKDQISYHEEVLRNIHKTLSNIQRKEMQVNVQIGDYNSKCTVLKNYIINESQTISPAFLSLIEGCSTEDELLLGVEKFQNYVQVQRNALGKQKNAQQIEKDEIESKGNTVILQSREEVSRMQQNILNTQNSIQAISKNISSNNQRLDDLKPISRASVRDQGSDLNNVQEELENTSSKLNALNFKVKIDQIEQNIQSTEAQQSQLRQDILEYNKRKDSVIKTKLQNERVFVKQEEIEELYTSKKSKIYTLMGEYMQDILSFEDPKRGINSLEKIEKKYSNLKKELEEKTHEKNFLNQSLSKSDGVLQNINHHFQQVDQQVKSMENVLQQEFKETLGVDYQGDLDSFNLGQKIKSLEKGKEDRLKNITTTNVMMDLIRQYVQVGRAHSKCPVCDNHFKGDQEKDKFVRIQENQMKQLPQMQSYLNDEIKKNDLQLSKIKQVQPTYIKYREIKDNQYNQLQNQITNIQTEQQGKQRQLEECEEVLVILKHEYDVAEELNRQLPNQIRSKYQEIEQIKRDLRRSQTLSQNSLGLNVREVDVNAKQSELDSLAQNYRNHLQEKDSLYKQKDQLQTQVNQQSIQKQNIQDLYNQAQGHLELKKNLQNEVQDLEEQNINEDRKLQQYKKELEKLQNHAQDMQKQYLNNRKNLDTQIRDLEGRLSQLLRTSEQIDDKLKDLHAAKQKLEGFDQHTLQLQKQEEENQKASNEEKIQDLNAQIRNTENTLQNKQSQINMLKDCINWREGVDFEKNISRQLEFKNKELQRVSQGYEKMHNELKSLQGKRSELEASQNQIKGQIIQIQSNLKEFNQSMKEDQYKNIYKRYNEQSLELQATEMASKDLELYHKALEKCLLTYHTQRMNNINTIIKQMWQQTYRGADIDYVHIVADAEQKSYNYRVVMHQNGVDLDMRGRCSAGQKVLACLIIRLALAEIFCNNCGILALDEPTTNLDAANSRSLAEALQQILEQRREQRNFQLVVITHDENFVQQLGVRTYADKVHKISKDESGHSIINTEFL